MSRVASASAAAGNDDDDDLHPAESWECTAGGGLSEAWRERSVDHGGGSSCSAGGSFRVQPPGLRAATCLVINCESLSRIIVEYCGSVVNDDGVDRWWW